MARPQWTVQNNHDLGTLNERSSVTDLPLPIDLTGVTLSLISGELPTGLRLVDNAIIGTPQNVRQATLFRFVLRATNADGIADRTFTLTIEGADAPEWVTPEGKLGVGPNKVLFILDSSPVDFQLEATDDDTVTGQTLEYYIADGDGTLPPGISLSRSGRLTGTVDPLRALDINEIVLGYDASQYAANVYDWGATTEDSTESLYYGDVDFTRLDLARPPRKLNRKYQFEVTVSDGILSAKRAFQIYVVGDDYVRADNTMMQAGDGVFTADATYVRTPIWITPSDLGIRRANNYVTLFLDTLDQPDVSGDIKYLLKGSNPGTYRLKSTGETVKGYYDLSGILPSFPDAGRTPTALDDDFVADPVRPEEFEIIEKETTSLVPDNLKLDPDTGELAGIVPYQPAITKDYKFSVGALRFDKDKGVVTVFATYYEDQLSGSSSLKVAKLPLGEKDGIDDLNDLVDQEVEIEGRIYKVISTDDSSTEFDIIQLDKVLQPLYSINPLVVSEATGANQDYFFVNKLTTNDILKYTGRELIYSDTENYAIDEIFTYSKYEVSTREGFTIGLNLGVVDFDTDFVTSVQEHLRGVTGREAYVSVNANVVTIFVASTNIINNGYIAGLFDTPDSSPPKVSLKKTIDRIKLSDTLARTFDAGRNISFAVLKRGSFNKSFAVDEIEAAESVKTFTLKILGEVDSVITWKSDSDLGSIKANRISTFKVEAETTVTDGKVKYSLYSGRLPYGLRLRENGEITGQIPVTGTEDNPGITRIDGDNTSFDGKTTSYDRTFEFTVLAKDRFVYSSITKKFKITVDAKDSLSYSNVVMKPFLKKSQRNTFDDFVNNNDVFDPTVLYRPSDSNFGVQKELKSLVFAGIERQTLGEFFSATTKNHKKKKFFFGDIKTATAKKEGTNEVVYEVVYVELIDPAKPKTGKARKSFTSVNGKSKITVDSVEFEQRDDRFGGNVTLNFFPIIKKNSSVFQLVPVNAQIEVGRRGQSNFILSATTTLELLDRNGQAITISTQQSVVEGTRDETWRRRPPFNTPKASDGAILVSDSQQRTHHISNIDNMRDNIEAIGEKSKDFLPLWMRTAQGSSLSELGYTLAVPLVYVKPGNGEQIKNNIDNQLSTGAFDFKTLNYEIDRYIVDSVEGETGEQYIVFGNYAHNA